MSITAQKLIFIALSYDKEPGHCHIYKPIHIFMFVYNLDQYNAKGFGSRSNIVSHSMSLSLSLNFFSELLWLLVDIMFLAIKLLEKLLPEGAESAPYLNL